MPKTKTVILYSAVGARKSVCLGIMRAFPLHKGFPNDKSFKLQFWGLVLTRDHLGAMDLIPQNDCLSRKKYQNCIFLMVLSFMEA